MNLLRRFISSTMVAMAIIATPASAASLVMDYTVTPTSGPLFKYDFTLRLDNQDSSWVPGQQWDWIIFGDSSGVPSPLADFSNFFSSDPAATLDFSSGGHNGPTVSYGANSVTLPGWQPASVGSTLTWSGNSSNFVGAGQMKFSTLVLGNGAARSDFQTANLIASAVPEPATWAMMLLGIGMIGGALRSSKRRKLVSKGYVERCEGFREALVLQ